MPQQVAFGYSVGGHDAVDCGVIYLPGKLDVDAEIFGRAISLSDSHHNSAALRD